MPKKPKILILRKGDVNPDPRIERLVYALEEKYYLTIFAFDNYGAAPKRSKIKDIPVIRFTGIVFTKGRRPPKILERINFLLYTVVIQFKIAFSNYSIIHACDFDTYFPALFVSKLKSTPVIYDVFDFYFDIIKNLPLALRKMVRTIDLTLMPYAKHILIADESRYVQIPDNLHQKTTVIYNTPPDLLKVFESKIIPTPRKRTKIIYLGLINFEKRDLRFFLDEIVKFQNEIEIEIYGKGKHYTQLNKLYETHANIQISSPIPYLDALERTYLSDYVLCIYDPEIGNNQLASPNKVFEGLMLGKPILINDELEIANLVRQHQLGFTFNFNDNDTAFKCLMKIAGNNEYSEMSENARVFYEKRFSFENLKYKLKDIYKNILNNG